MSVYNQGTDFLSDTDDVIKLARNVPLGDFTVEEVEDFQFMRYSQIRTKTDYDAWGPADREYGALKLAETKLVASDLMEHYGDVNAIPLWTAMRETAVAELAGIVENLETTGGGDVSGGIIATEPKSWNLNSSLPPPNRLTNVNGGVEGKGSSPLGGIEVDL